MQLKWTLTNRVKLSENQKILKTKSSSDLVFEQKSVELLRYATFNGDCNAEKRIHVISKQR